MPTEPTTDDLLNKLTDIVRPLVAAIQSKPPITKDNYDQYMLAIDRIASQLGEKPSTSVYLAVGVALQRAGASCAGVQSALRAMGHL